MIMRFKVSIIVLFVLVLFSDLSLCDEYDDERLWSDTYFMAGFLTGPYGGIGILAGFEYDWHPISIYMFSPEITYASDVTFENIAIFVGGTVNLTFGSRDSQFFIGIGPVYGIKIRSDSIFYRPANATYKAKVGYNAGDFKIYAYINGVYDPFDCGFLGLCVSWRL